MKTIRVFPSRTSMTPNDDPVFVGDPGMIRPSNNHMSVHVSCAFTWEKEKAKRLAAAWSQFYIDVKLGGPAFDDCGEIFIPGFYLKNGIVMTSRGCNNQCPWCLVWRREGKLRELPVISGNVIQDNNILQCGKLHLDKLFRMLRQEKIIQFSGGLDAGLLRREHVEELRALKIHQLFFACDTKGAIWQLRNAGDLLKDFPRGVKRCYVLLAFGNQTLSQAQEHLEDVWRAGFMTFAQLYQPPDKLISYSKEWRDLARRWSRPAIMKSIMHEK